MTREITQHQLHNQSGEIMRAVEAGESFIVMRRGVAIAERTPVQRRRFVNRDAILDAFAKAAPIDATRFRSDVARIIGRDPIPRA